MLDSSGYPVDMVDAEKRAFDATKLSAFPINLLEIRRTVRLILGEFGKHGFFDEYTVHDFSHCLEMLKMLDWIVPEPTKSKMSPADWLVVVLSCYFHDMGLFISREEFASRDKSNFPAFKSSILRGDWGEDYVYKIQQLPPDDQERFLYQEFVRENHGSRIRAWIEGKTNNFGVAEAAIKELHELLNRASPKFRRDLAIVCESHNLDDLKDLKKYRISEPYGNSTEETANLQYAAILLRTVDLLQITKQRAPTALFRLISPTDPISQREWSKQNAVTSVRAKIARNKENKLDPAATKHTVEIHAQFNDGDGFFGLTSYLRYAKDQLLKSHEVAEASNRDNLSEFEFPWKDIDDEFIEAEGFLKEKYGFELDQGKILDLLTGHTLYNDSNVVVRELVQNSIDAVRLVCETEALDPRTAGLVRINWNAKDLELEVLDNGTGMTQRVIQNHLLKVGSSRYQDKQFKEDHPNFSSISRFGIGVLSAFMIADNVKIITCSPDEPEAREVSLHSVHGRYLIRLLDKSSGPDASRISPHGTIVRLSLRQTAKDFDVLAALRRWIVVPECQVETSINNGKPISVGYPSTRVALEQALEAGAGQKSFDSSETKVVEKELGGCTIAYALRYSKLFREWSLVPIDEEEKRRVVSSGRGSLPFVGTCVEGISIEASTPGFRDLTFLALVNAKGLGAPKTNVARSSLEDTKESEELRRKIFKAYFDYVEGEANRLIEEEKYSKTWAANEIPYIANWLTATQGSLLQDDCYWSALDELPMFLVEHKKARQMLSLKALRHSKRFWTIQSELIDQIERLVRESSAEISMGALVEVCQKGLQLPSEDMVSNLTGLRREVATRFFAPKEFVHYPSEQRVDLAWEEFSDQNGWISTATSVRAENRAILEARLQQGMVFRRRRSDVKFGATNIRRSNLDGFMGVRAHDTVWLFPDNPVTQLLIKLNGENGTGLAIYVYGLLINSLPSQFMSNDSTVTVLNNSFKRVRTQFGEQALAGEKEFLSAVSNTALAIFDPFARSSRGGMPTVEDII